MLTRYDAISPPTYAARAVTDQLGRLHHVSNLYYTAEQGKLGEWLVKNSVADKCVLPFFVLLVWSAHLCVYRSTLIGPSFN